MKRLASWRGEYRLPAGNRSAGSDALLGQRLHPFPGTLRIPGCVRTPGAPSKQMYSSAPRPGPRPRGSSVGGPSSPVLAQGVGDRGR